MCCGWCGWCEVCEIYDVGSVRCVLFLFCSADDLDLELRLARFEELMDRRPFLLSR